MEEMEEEDPRINDVRLSGDGVLEFFDGTAWATYPDVPDDAAPPNALSREGNSR